MTKATDNADSQGGSANSGPSRELASPEHPILDRLPQELQDIIGEEINGAHPTPVEVGDNLDTLLFEILVTHRSETWATGWNNRATENALAELTSLINQTVAEAYKKGYIDGGIHELTKH